jgi:NDP-sugar pyrophosphorylase family protein
VKAMVLAAGIGTRLRPLTDKTPKALIEVGGVPMLERVLRRLIAAGVDEAVVNLHYLPSPIEAFLKAKKDFGIRIFLSREEGRILDTGGALKKAAMFLRGKEPFFVHNVDVLSDLDLGALHRAHRQSGALATLAVRERETSRKLLFSADDRLVGREEDRKPQWAGKPVSGAQALGFDGVHVVSPALLDKMTETGVFSINAVYLRLAAAGERIQAFRADKWRWLDVGSPEKLERARREFSS